MARGRKPGKKAETKTTKTTKTTKKATKKANVVMNASILLTFPQDISGTVEAVDSNHITMVVKRHRSKKYDQIVVPMAQVAGIFTPEQGIGELTDLIGKDATVTKFPEPGVYEAFRGEFTSVEGFLGVAGDEGTFLASQSIVEISGEDEEALNAAKKRKAEEEDEEEEAPKKKKPGRPKKVQEEEEDEEDEEDEEEEEEEEEDEDDGVSAEDIAEMSKKDIKALIKENELDINPADYDDLDDLREAVIEELGLEEV